MALYDRMARELDDPRRVFLNFGAAGPSEDLHGNLVLLAIGEVSIGGRTILDVGCGRGGSSEHLRRLGGAVTSLDRCLGHARWNRRFRHSRFAAGDAQALPFPDQSFDVVFNLESAHCYGDFKAFLAEVQRVLRPGGDLCCADLWGLEVLGHDWRARQRALEECGLEVVADEDLSEVVYQALGHPEGVIHGLDSSATARNRAFLNALRADHEAVRLHLAAGQCAYRALRMKK